MRDFRIVILPARQLNRKSIWFWQFGGRIYERTRYICRSYCIYQAAAWDALSFSRPHDLSMHHFTTFVIFIIFPTPYYILVTLRGAPCFGVHSASGCTKLWDAPCKWYMDGVKVCMYNNADLNVVVRHFQALLPVHYKVIIIMILVK